jgi:hypothetical protein
MFLKERLPIYFIIGPPQQTQQPKPIITAVGGQPVQPIRYGLEAQPAPQQPTQPPLTIPVNQVDPMGQQQQPQPQQQAGVIRLASGGSIPHLTEEQKKIVAEFKQKMALLPPDQHTQFIATHKANLIKQLNFQPTQLQLLRSSQVIN